MKTVFGTLNNLKYLYKLVNYMLIFLSSEGNKDGSGRNWKCIILFYAGISLQNKPQLPVIVHNLKPLQNYSCCATGNAGIIRGQKSVKYCENYFGEINQNISNTEDEIERCNPLWNLKYLYEYMFFIHLHCQCPIFPNSFHKIFHNTKYND
jgi:hypothetical protein